MAGSKIERKVRFLPYFPYGACSKLATTLEGKENHYATLLLLGEDPDKTIRECEQHHKKILERARYLCDTAFAEDRIVKCGTPAKNRSFRYLAPKGLAAFMEIDPATTAKEIGKNEHDPVNDGDIKGSHFRIMSEDAAAFRDALSFHAANKSAEGKKAFDAFLLEAVIQREVTPLSYAADIAEQATSSTYKYSENQRYKIWQLSHISIMFLLNGYLTYLDRRPHDTGFAIDGIVDQSSYEAYVKKHGHTMASMT